MSIFHRKKARKQVNANKQTRTLKNQDADTDTDTNTDNRYTYSRGKCKVYQVGMEKIDGKQNAGGHSNGNAGSVCGAKAKSKVR